jgi:hypothetical protein
VASTQIELPDEAVDVTVSELHYELVQRLYNLLRIVFGDSAVVLAEMFVRLGDRQVSPDVFIVPGARPGSRRIYDLTAEAVPAVTIEVLSPANETGVGREELDRKRAFLGEIGVPFHLEIEPHRGYLTVWRNTGGTLAVSAPEVRFEGPELGGVTVVCNGPADVELLRPDGTPYVSPAAETQRADAETQRAERLAARLRALGVDPDAE